MALTICLLISLPSDSSKKPSPTQYDTIVYFINHLYLFLPMQSEISHFLWCTNLLRDVRLPIVVPTDSTRTRSNMWELGIPSCWHDSRENDPVDYCDRRKERISFLYTHSPNTNPYLPPLKRKMTKTKKTVMGRRTAKHWIVTPTTIH